MNGPRCLKALRYDVADIALQDTPLNSRQQKVINRLLDAGEKIEGSMTTRKYAGMTKCSKVTASRDLSDLLDKKILQKTAAGGRSTSDEIGSPYLTERVILNGHDTYWFENVYVTIDRYSSELQPFQVPVGL